MFKDKLFVAELVALVGLGLLGFGLCLAQQPVVGLRPEPPLGPGKLPAKYPGQFNIVTVRYEGHDWVHVYDSVRCQFIHHPSCKCQTK